jgi:hypothetical protein
MKSIEALQVFEFQLIGTLFRAMTEPFINPKLFLIEQMKYL